MALTTTDFEYYNVEVKVNLRNGNTESFVIDFVTDKEPAKLVYMLARGRYGEKFSSVAEFQRLERVTIYKEVDGREFMYEYDEYWNKIYL